LWADEERIALTADPCIPGNNLIVFSEPGRDVQKREIAKTVRDALDGQDRQE
jgi:hypothetical protein